jgi:hypothetical protein
MKKLVTITIWSLVALSMVAFQNCAKSGEISSPSAPGQVLPGSFEHQVTGNYSALVSSGGQSQSLVDGYSFDYNEDSPGKISGRHNFQGIQSGFKKFEGTRSGDNYTYHSIECSGDTFSGSFSLTTGQGNFSGTICGLTFSNGSLSAMNQVK